MPFICICIFLYIHLYQQKSKIMYTTTDDPSNGYSSHWSNGPKENDDCCPTCGREANLMRDHYLCKSCNETFNYFDENGEFIND